MRLGSSCEQKYTRLKQVKNKKDLWFEAHSGRNGLDRRNLRQMRLSLTLNPYKQTIFHRHLMIARLLASCSQTCNCMCSQAGQGARDPFEKALLPRVSRIHWCANAQSQRPTMNTNLKVIVAVAAVLAASPVFAASHVRHQAPAAPAAHPGVVVGPNGQVLGADPDPQVRFELLRDWPGAAAAGHGV
jgi:hypothetical protein